MHIARDNKRGANSPPIYINKQRHDNNIANLDRDKMHCMHYDYNWNISCTGMGCTPKRQRQTTNATRTPGQLGIWLVCYWMVVGIILGVQKITINLLFIQSKSMHDRLYHP